MDRRRTQVVVAIVSGLLLFCAAGCASPAGQASGAQQTGAADIAAGSSAAAAPRSVTPLAARQDLAPDGAAPGGSAPGGAAPLDEGDEQPAAEALARSVGCVEPEPQAHVAAVDEQVSCRRGAERTYLMTFRSTADRDICLAHAPQVVSGGFNVIGKTFVVHVPTMATARFLAAVLPGQIRAGS